MHLIQFDIMKLPKLRHSFGGHIFMKNKNLKPFSNAKQMFFKVDRESFHCE